MTNHEPGMNANLPPRNQQLQGQATELSLSHFRAISKKAGQTSFRVNFLVKTELTDVIESPKGHIAGVSAVA